MNLRKIYTAVILAAACFCTSPAQATVYEYNGNYNNNGLTSTNFRYDTVNQTLSLAFTADPALATFGGNWSGQQLDGFWLVLSDGPNPQTGARRDSAILYADLNNNIISSFVYTDVGNSYNTALIERFDGALNITRNGTSTSIDFQIDASNINAYSSGLTSNDWNGVAFGPRIGTWLHPSFSSQIRYDNNGVLDRFVWSGWIGGDENFRTTTRVQPTEVPEPTTPAMMLLCLGAAKILRRRNRE